MRAALDAADADTADELVVVDGGNQQLQRRVRVALRSGDVVEDGFKQRPQVLARHVPVESWPCRSRPEAKTMGLSSCSSEASSSEQQFQRLVHHLGAARVGAVGLVDDDDDLAGRGSSACWSTKRVCGIGPSKRVHQQQNAVHHLEHALHLAAEIGVAGGIDDVDASRPCSARRCSSPEW